MRPPSFPHMPDFLDRSVQRTSEEIEDLPITLVETYDALAQGISYTFHDAKNITLTNHHAADRSDQSIRVDGKIPDFLDRYREIRSATYDSLLAHAKETGDFSLLLQTIDTLQDPVMAAWLLAKIHKKKEEAIPIVVTTGHMSKEDHYKKREEDNQEIDTFKKLIVAYAHKARIGSLLRKALETDNNILRAIAYTVRAKTTPRTSQCVTQIFLDPLATIAQRLPIEVQCYEREKASVTVEEALSGTNYQG